MLPTTKTDIAKMAVQMVVTAKASKLAEGQILQHTDLDPDGNSVSILSGIAGALVGLQLKPFTDKAVDKTVELYQSWRENKNSENQVAKTESP